MKSVLSNKFTNKNSNRSNSQPRKLKLKPTIINKNSHRQSINNHQTQNLLNQAQNNQQIRCLSHERNKYKYQKMLSKSDKSEMLSNICSLQQQFDEILQQQHNSRKSNTSNKTHKSHSQKLITSLNIKSSDKQNSSNWHSGIKQSETNQQKQMKENDITGKRSIVLMNKYAPKSTINLLDQKYPRDYKTSTSILYTSNSSFDNMNKYQNTTLTTKGNDSLQVIAIGLSSSKKQNRADIVNMRKSYKLKLRKGIDVVSAKSLTNRKKLTLEKNTYR